MDSAKADLADKLKSANNILVTVSRNPSVDQLSACIGLTLLLNKMGKHAAAIFSGEVPSTIEFLQPEETLEKNTDSLRDFIIALDKSKADKLRYKVEDNVVRIFITPYRTSIGQEDLEFSQGDFNVDVVVALGVQEQDDLDNAITMHGRILHDAVVASINTTAEGGLGSITWHDPQASSLSELVTELSQAVGDDLIDSQIATALLTGVVAETDRFSNDKTSSQTMNTSAKLMSAGANQQLVASKLEGPQPTRPAVSHDRHEEDKEPPAEAVNQGDGTLQIKHETDEEPEEHEDRHEHEQEDRGGHDDHPAWAEIPEASDHDHDDHLATDEHDDRGEEQTTEPRFAPIGPARLTDDGSQGFELPSPQFKPQAEPHVDGDHTLLTGGLMTEAPAMGGTLNANAEPEHFDPLTDPLTLGGRGPAQLLDHGDGTPKQAAPPPPPPPPEPSPAFSPPPPPPQAAAPPPPPPPSAPDPFLLPVSDEPTPPVGPPTPPPAVQDDGQTLADIEASVNSPHLHPPNLDNVRDQVNQALVGDRIANPEPLQSLGAQPLGTPLHMPDPPAMNTQPGPGPGPVDPGSVFAPAPQPAEDLGGMPPLGGTPPPLPPRDDNPPPPSDPNAPPPVPPPIPFQFGTPPGPTPPNPGPTPL